MGSFLLRGRRFESPNYAEQPLLLVGLQADEFDPELVVSRPSPHGQMDRERSLRLVEMNLNLKIFHVRCRVGTPNPAPFAGDVDDRSALSDPAVAEIHRKRDR